MSENISGPGSSHDQDDHHLGIGIGVVVFVVVLVVVLVVVAFLLLGEACSCANGCVSAHHVTACLRNFT